jgi:hypothetical protein
MSYTRKQTEITVDVLDRDGYATDRVVTVQIDYTISVDNNYGADADGRRGIRLVEVEDVEASVAPEVATTLLAEELAQVKADALTQFEFREEYN